MINRIKLLAEHFHLSPTAFADQIGVARPVISHIFSARNRPSLEVIQKIGVAFKEVNLDWLLYGQGKMLRSLEVNSADPLSENATNSEEKPEQLQQTEQPPPGLSTNIQELASGFVKPVSENKKVFKVMFFYEDNTFEEFRPGN